MVPQQHNAVHHEWVFDSDLLKLETCTRTRCPMASAALRRKYRTAGGRVPRHHRLGTKSAMPSWIATARSRLPHPASVSLPSPFAPQAGHVASTHLQLRASHCRRDVCRVYCQPMVSSSRYQPSTPLLLESTRSLSGGIVHPGGRSITPSTANSLHWCHSNTMLCITSGCAVLTC